MGAPMFGNVQDFELEPLRRLLKLELVGYSEELQETLWTVVNSAFDNWKKHRATKDEYAAPNLFSLLGPRTDVSDEAFAKAHPWHCAGFGVRCRTDLAYKLWLEDDPVFQAVLDVAGVGRVFAVLGLREDPLFAGAMIRVAGMLMDMHIRAFARHFEQATQKEKKKLAALAEGRKKGASALKAKTAEKIRAMREYARSYFVRFPTHSYDDAVRELLTKPYTEKQGGGRYSARRVGEIIRGVKDEAFAAIEASRR